MSTTAKSDWTAIYRMQMPVEEEVPVELKSADKMSKEWLSLLTGCSHDHKAEQRVFDLPQHHKLAACALYQNLGHDLFEEGAYNYALERFHRSLVYYEYSFPDSKVEEVGIGFCRLRALLASAASCIRLKKWDEAYKHVMQADRMIAEIRELLKESPDLEAASHEATVSEADSTVGGVNDNSDMSTLSNRAAATKALQEMETKNAYRKAVVFRHMHEYEAAKAAISDALRALPTDALARREALLLRAWQASSKRREKEVAQRMFAADAGAAKAHVSFESASLPTFVDDDDAASIVSAAEAEDNTENFGTSKALLFE